MPSSKQAKKRLVQDERRRAANKVKRSAMRTAVKKVLQADNAADAKAALPQAVKRVDKCAKHNIIHANAAARTKSQLSRKVTALEG